MPVLVDKSNQRNMKPLMTFDMSNADVQQQIIYEYHRVEIESTKITNFSAVEFTAMPSKLSMYMFIKYKDVLQLCMHKLQKQHLNQTSWCSACLQHDNCEICLSSNQTSGCSWCNILQR